LENCEARLAFTGDYRKTGFRAAHGAAIDPKHFVIVFRIMTKLEPGAYGDRLNQLISPLPTGRLCATADRPVHADPFSFWGQEWASSKPFYLFHVTHDEWERRDRRPPQGVLE